MRTNVCPAQDAPAIRSRAGERPAIEWDGTLKAWLVRDPSVAVQILQSPAFKAPDYTAAYAALERGTDLQFPATIGALAQMPLAHEGDRHTQLREDFARAMSAGAPAEELKTVARHFLDEHIPNAFAPDATVDLVETLLRPLCDRVFCALLGLAPSSADSGTPSVSQIFDRTLGLNRRVAIEAKIAALTAALDANPNAAAPADLRAAICIVAYDSLLGSLGCALLKCLMQADGAPLNTQSYPENLPATAVPYVERTATAPQAIAGIEIAAGSRIRCMLDSRAGPSSPSAGALYFGAGRHVCLGKTLTQSLWQNLAAHLAALPVSVRVERATRREPDYVFVFYESILVSIDA